MICPTCHTRLKKACPACGRLLHLRWNLCPYCGAVQTAVKAPSQAVPQVSLAVDRESETLELSGMEPASLPEAARRALPGDQDSGWEPGSDSDGEPGSDTLPNLG